MRALIIVDVQNDFCPGGALAVTDGDGIIPGINRLASAFDVVVTTMDWHPADHGSFASNHPGAAPYEVGRLAGRAQVLWPDHCVQGSRGAALHSGLTVCADTIHKGTDPQADSYSGFFDDGGAATGLDALLRARGVTEVFVCGLATDFCVKFTVLDALRCGYRTTLIEDLCRGVNLRADDSRDAVQAMADAGASICRSDEVEQL